MKNVIRLFDDCARSKELRLGANKKVTFVIRLVFSIFSSMVRTLSCFFVLGFLNFSFTQNPNFLLEEFDGATPCFLALTPEGEFPGSTGDDLTDVSYDTQQSLMMIDVKTHASEHAPLYYVLSKGDDIDCEPNKGAVNVSHPQSSYTIRAKASENMQVIVYLQEGNEPSLDSTKRNATPLILNLTTEMQSFCPNEIDANPAVGSTPLDLSNIGGLVFELGKSDEINYDQVDGKIFIERLYFHQLGQGNCIDEPWSISDVPSFNYQLFPNPNDGTFSIELEESQNSTVSIHGLSGNLIEEMQSEGQSKIDFTTSLSLGIYFIRIQTNTGTEVAKMIVK